MSLVFPSLASNATYFNIVPKDLLVLVRGNSTLLSALELFFCINLEIFDAFTIALEFGKIEVPLDLFFIGIMDSIKFYFGLRGPTSFSYIKSAFCRCVEFSSANDWNVYWFISLTLTGVILATWLIATCCQTLLSICASI